MLKPPRAHHCSICDRCIMKMDHHCPWVGGCVGFNNHKLFLQFLVYTASGCLYTGLTQGIYTIAYSDKDFTEEGVPMEFLITGSVLAVALFLAIIFLLGTHFYFVFTNQCSVEAGGLQIFNPFFVDNMPVGQQSIENLEV